MASTTPAAAENGRIHNKYSQLEINSWSNICYHSPSYLEVLILLFDIYFIDQIYFNYNSTFEAKVW